jgi:8-oxo-dGTP pyrophosphatase MutT (NUDIX family)
MRRFDGTEAAEEGVVNEERGELRRVERSVVRLVVLDAANHVLPLQTRDLGNPAFGTSWELPGGGVEPGETPSRPRP